MREISGRSWRDVDVGEVELLARESSVDEDRFGETVVDRRVELEVRDGVMDERDEATTTPRPVAPDDRITRKRRSAGGRAKFRLLNACYQHVIPGDELVQFRCRVPDAIAVPGDNARRGRRRLLTRTRVWMDASDGEEREDERAGERCDDEEEELREPARVRGRHYAGLIPPR